MVGAMNTASQIGAFVSSLVFGFLVSRYGSYNLPFIPMALLLMMGAALWLKVSYQAAGSGAAGDHPGGCTGTGEKTHAAPTDTLPQLCK